VRVLLIGGTGFLGYHASLALRSHGHQVAALARSVPKGDLLPADVGVYVADIATLDEAELRALLEQFDAVVFAAGADDRAVPAAPAYPYFRDANVVPVVRLVRTARKAGLLRVVILGSYFAFFDRLWPGLEIAGRHPYVRSRVEQTTEAFAAAEGEIDVVTLELPYVFGATPGRVPLWAPLIRYIRSPAPVFSTKGGTNMIAVGHVGEAVVGAVERGLGRMRYLVGDENLRWVAFLERLSAAAGRRRKVITVPTPIVRAGLFGVKAYHKTRSREAGLDPVAFVDLQTAETFFDPSVSRSQLGYGSGSLDEAFEATARASVAE